ncbi:MAG: 16S rRNA (cytidine(1402)-2'-O)-methyltransferase [Actinobacteria bacterium]|nr:16S rRNA (cytidine(1402)-2'-O)-methyltransferase [Actinomycetota bacterium]
MQQEKGTLFICGTPIGNLEDASFRLIETLKSVDLIISEDTRTAKKLLARYDVKKEEIESYHDNTSRKKSEAIIKKIESGMNVAIVSESGMPLISDPGFKLVRLCIERNIKITVIPGPDAAASALVLSGLPADNFLFIGFLPKTVGKLKKKLEELKTLPYTMIFYESPNRIEALLEEIKSVFGERKICLAREITKIYEECIRGSTNEVFQLIKERTGKGIKLKGEIVLVVSGHEIKRNKDFTDNIIKNELKCLFKKGMTKKEAFKNIMAKYEISRQDLYNISINLKNFKIN